MVAIATLVVWMWCPSAMSAERHAGRKKVAVVLSGGGAKGMAHIGALRVIERAGIPIDIITGTSMGSIVGGLYAIGYDAHRLDSMVRKQDWSFLLTDKIEAHSPLLDNRKRQNTYFLSKLVTFEGMRVTNKVGGIIEGRNLDMLFGRLVGVYGDSLDFDRLPIPFACVATNIVDNTEYVFHGGRLKEAMRSSMAIPGVFSPVRKDSMVLVDGGLRNNFPVDVARAMGADVVIGVTVQERPRTADDLKNTASVLLQIVDINCKNKYDENLAMTDVPIQVNTEGYSAASFNTAAIDTLIRRGEEAAMGQWDGLLALKRKIGVGDSFVPERPAPCAEILQEEDAVSGGAGKAVADILVAGLGVRFDSEELVALQLNGVLSPKNTPLDIEATIRLGKRIMARADMHYKPVKSGGMRLSYVFGHDDINFYDRGDRAFNVTYNHHVLDFSPFNFDMRNFKFSLGARWDYYSYNDVLSRISDGVAGDTEENEHFVSYYANVRYNSENEWYFPTRGARFEAGYRFHTDNFVDYNGHRGFSELTASWRMSFPLTSRLTFQPMVYGRMLFGGDIPLSSGNVVGGEAFGRYVEQQMPFAGVGHAEYVDNQLLALQLTACQRMGENNYLSLRLSAMRSCDKVGDLFASLPKVGALLGYSYASVFGPLGGSLGWSNQTHGVCFYVNMGFEF